MSSGRIGGAGDPKEPKSPADEIKDPRLRKIEKVKEVDEAENEGRRKKFRKFMDGNEKTESPPRDPSPFETEFHKVEKNLGSAFNELTHPLNDLENQLNRAVDSSDNSPSPNLETPGQEDPNSLSPPPSQSQESWNDTSSKSEDAAKTHQESEKKKEEAKEKIEILTDLDPMDLKKKGEKTEKEKQETITVPIEEEKKVKAPFGKLTPEEEAKISPHITKKAKEKERTLAPIQEQAILKKDHREKERDGKQETHPPHIIEIDYPSSTQLPGTVIPLAQVATTQATPYLSSEISPLFFQMVGTIHVMRQTPGLTETEIELNSPSFSKSKFFGAKIIIEKHATAPNSFNIRLTGSNQAVKAFNENLSNLYAAFENGTFDFKIGRISAEYSTEATGRPVFRRKEGKSGDDSDSSRREK